MRTNNMINDELKGEIEEMNKKNALLRMTYEDLKEEMDKKLRRVTMEYEGV